MAAVSTSPNHLVTYGWIPDNHDPRDFPLYDSEATRSLLEPSTQVKTSKQGLQKIANPPPVYNQGEIGSCVANAVGAAVRYALHKGWDLDYENFQPSRLSIYYNARTHGDPDEAWDTNIDTTYKAEHDTGTKIRKALVSMLAAGVCSEEAWPYGNPDVREEPGEPFKVEKDANGQAYALDGHGNRVASPVMPYDQPGKPSAFHQAKNWLPRQIGFYRIFNPNANLNLGEREKQHPPPIELLEQCIDDGYPFVFGISFYPSARLSIPAHIDQNGVFNKPPTELVEDVSGHAMLCIGYDHDKKLLLVQNSWGAKWPADKVTNLNDGNGLLKGLFWLPYEWVTESFSQELIAGKLHDVRHWHTDDFWCIRTTGDPSERPKPEVPNPAHWGSQNAGGTVLDGSS